MTGRLRALVAAAALIALSASAAPPANPIVGTWRLNLARSTFSPGPAPRSQIRHYVESGAGVTLTMTTVAADGRETTITLTFTEDGRRLPASTSPDYDTVAAEHVDARTVHSTQFRNGVVVGTGVRTVSADGRTLTFAQQGTHADGVRYRNVSVYDRQ